MTCLFSILCQGSLGRPSYFHHGACRVALRRPVRPLLDQTRHPALILWLLADGELDSELKHTFTRQGFIATSIFSAKRNKRAWRL